MQADWARAAHQEPVAVLRHRQRSSCSSRNQKDITSLIEEFQYPKYGPGMMWERCAEKVEAAGTKIHFSTCVERIHRDGLRAVEVVASSEGR